MHLHLHLHDGFFFFVFFVLFSIHTALTLFPVPSLCVGICMMVVYQLIDQLNNKYACEIVI